MLTKLSKNTYAESPWKNGKGKTRQVAIYPIDATLSDFSYRISSATVSADGPFSIFENKKRHLLIWKGTGLKLNDYTLLPNKIYSFDGSDAIDCKLLSGEVIDLGIIYDPAEFRVSLETITYRPGETLELPIGEHFLFLAEGQFHLENLHLEAGDTLKIDSRTSQTLLLLCKQALTIYKISINRVRE